MSARLSSILILLATLLLTFLSLFLIRPHLSQFDHLLTQIGIFGPLLAIGIYTLLSLTPIPTDPLTIILGALYGPFYGLLISWLGNTSAALLEYFIAHHLGSLTRFDQLKHKLPWGLAKAPVDSFWFLTLGRIVPGFGSKMVSILAGLYHVHLPRYLLTSSAMNFLGGLGYVLAGFFLTRT